MQPFCKKNIRFLVRNGFLIEKITKSSEYDSKNTNVFFKKTTQKIHLLINQSKIRTQVIKNHDHKKTSVSYKETDAK